MTGRAKLAAAVGMVVLAAGTAWALEHQIDSDQNFNNHHATHLPAPAGPTEPARVQDVAPGACITKATGANTLPLVCSVAGTDFQAPMSAADATVVFPTANTVQRGALTGDVTASAGSTVTSVGAVHETSGPTQLTIGAIPNAGYLLRSGTALVGSTTIPYSVLTGTPSALPPSGSASGDLGGTYPAPTVVASEWSGTRLTFGALADGALPKRSGTSLIAAVDGTDYLSPATGVTIAGHAATSVFGRSANSTGVGADISCPTSGTFLGNASGSLACSAITPSTAGTVATWSRTGVRVFCLDSNAIDDSGLGYADSADTTQANVAIASAACGAVAKKTAAGLSAIIPPFGDKRNADVLVAAGTYAEPVSQFDRSGYATFVIRGTATNSTASSTAFSGSTADLTYSGAVTGTGMNAAGYNPTSSTTSDTITLAKVGGGSPSFAAEPAIPVGLRWRWDAATATSALRNTISMIVERTSATTIRLQSAVAFTTSDVGYIEQPGALFTVASSFTGTNQTTAFNGIASTSTFSASRGSYSLAFCSSTGSFSGSGNSSWAFGATSLLTPFPTIGPSRAETITTVTGGAANFGNNSYTTGTTFAATGVSTLTFGDNNVVGTNVTITGGRGGSLFSSAAVFGGNTFNARVLGFVTLDGAHIIIRNLNLPNTTSQYGVVVEGHSAVTFGAVVSGGLKTVAGMDFTNAYQSSIMVEKSHIPTITGSGGDIFWGNYTILNPGNAIYFSWAAVNSLLGAIVFPNGASITSPPAIASSGSSMYGGTHMATMAYNQTGSSIPIGSVVVFNFTDGSSVAPAQADTLAHLKGGIGITADTIAASSAGFVYTDGPSLLAQQESGGCPGHAVTSGWQLTYVSATTAGTFTCTKPAIARVLGWTTSENQITLAPDNITEPIGQIYANGTAQNNEPGLNFPAEFSMSDNAGAGRTDLTLASLAAAKVTGLAAIATSGSATDLTAGTVACARLPSLTGDVTNSACATTIANDAVTNAKLANMATANFKARITAGTGDPEDITGTQATTLLDAFTSSLKGLAPASGGGSSNFLRADGTWATPTSSGGTVTSVSGTVPIVCSPSSPNPTCSLQFDNATITLNGGNAIQRAALTGAITAAAGSNTTAFGNLAGLSVLGRSAGSTGVPAAITSTTSGDVFWNNAGTLSWSLIPESSVTGLTTDLAAKELALTFSTGLTRTTNTITSNLSTGVSGGQTIIGGTAAGNSLTISSTSNATKGTVIFGTTTKMLFNEAATTLTIGGAVANASLSVNSGASVAAIHFANGTSDDGGYLISTSGDQAIMAGGSTFNGSSWVAKNATASIFSMASGSVFLSTDAGLTPGVNYTPTTRVTVTSTGHVQLSDLAAGGMVKANVTTGQLAIAAAGTDYVHSVSAGAGMTNVGTSANPILGMLDFGSPGTYGGAGSYIEEIVTDVKGRVQFVQPRALLAQSWNLPYYVQLFSGAAAFPMSGSGLATSLSTAPAGVNGIEYQNPSITPNFVLLAVNLIANTNSVGTGTFTITVTRNGTAVPGASVTYSQSSAAPQTDDTGKIAVSSGSPSDTFGLSITSTGSFVQSNLVFTSELQVTTN